MAGEPPRRSSGGASGNLTDRDMRSELQEIQMQQNLITDEVSDFFFLPYYLSILLTLSPPAVKTQ
jgi:hypothetical protein